MTQQRLHVYGQNKIWCNRQNFICVGNHRVCRYLPIADRLEFQVSMVSGGKYVKRLVEVKRQDFIQHLTEIIDTVCHL